MKSTETQNQPGRRRAPGWSQTLARKRIDWRSTGWRVPTLNELASTIDEAKVGGAIFAEAFPEPSVGCQALEYWLRPTSQYVAVITAFTERAAARRTCARPEAILALQVAGRLAVNVASCVGRALK